jgi:hypothetical protein
MTPKCIRTSDVGDSNCPLEQCCGPMRFWCGSGSTLMHPDPAIFVIDFQDANKKLIFLTSFSAYYFLKVHLNHFSKIKSQKEVTKQ